MLFRTSAIILAGAAAIAGTAIAASDARSPKEARELAEALRGRVAGAPVNCINNFPRTGRMQVVDDNTILFHTGGTLYLQSPRGGCPGLKNEDYALVRRAGSHQLCRGDVEHLVDLETGIRGGACVLGPFVPYRKSN